MRSRSHIFWASLGLTLLLLVPMVLFVLFLVDQRARQNHLREAAADTTLQVEPGAQSSYRLLLVLQREDPAFVLLRVDAPRQAITFVGLPGALRVAAPAGTTTLGACTLAAGPGRAAQLLLATLYPATGESAAPPLDYLAATPATWAACAGVGANARFDTAALLGAGAAKAEVLSLGLAEAPAAIASLETLLENPGDAAAARAAVWAAFARQNPTWLAGWPAALKQQSARLLYSLRAQDLANLADTLDYLAARSALTVDYKKAPTAEAAGEVWLTAAGEACLREVLG